MLNSETEKRPVRVFVQIAVWNSMKFLPELLRSLEAQTFRDFKVLVIDNASTDGLDKFLAAYPLVTVLRNFRNLGFARAHNQGIRWALKQTADAGSGADNSFVLLLNPDTVLSPDVLQKLVQCADADKSLGSVGARLLRYVFASDGSVEFTTTIDSLGLEVRPSRQVVDRGAGLDISTYQHLDISNVEVFGISGALVLYRLAALAEAAVTIGETTEYLDEDFFIYKEDVDLAWRLQLLGWRAAIAPEAVAYHHRGAPGGARGLWGIISTERRKGAAIARHSARNHLLTLIKNEQHANFFRQAPQIMIHESAKFLFRLCLAPRALAGYADALRLIPKMRTKRRLIQSRAKQSAEAMRRWFEKT